MSLILICATALIGQSGEQSTPASLRAAFKSTAFASIYEQGTETVYSTELVTWSREGFTVRQKIKQKTFDGKYDVNGKLSVDRNAIDSEAVQTVVYTGTWADLKSLRYDLKPMQSYAVLSFTPKQVKTSITYSSIIKGAKGPSGQIQEDLDAFTIQLKNPTAGQKFVDQIAKSLRGFQPRILVEAIEN
jgi:hypothetical protein